jgi:4-hydroxybenzoate polyprenyltransferase
MRSAGCIINDIADRRWDGYVERTKNRPLANSSMHLGNAWLMLFGLLIIALFILAQLPPQCIYAAIPAALITFIYPFTKRFLKTPQLILGFAFAASIPMVMIATHQIWNSTWTILLCITILWVIAYDTQYALTDIEDDLKLGIQSTAIFFKQYVHQVIFSLQISISILWILLAHLQHFSTYFDLAIFLSLGFWIIQAKVIRNNPLQAFKNNTWYGLWIWLALLLEKL